jgi:hypothetical protein
MQSQSHSEDITLGRDSHTVDSTGLVLLGNSWDDGSKRYRKQRSQDPNTAKTLDMIVNRINVHFLPVYRAQLVGSE